MQIRCYRCGWSFAIKQEEAAFALEALEETGGTHYDSNCPRCRHSNRVSLEQLRKATPRSAEETETPEPQNGDKDISEAEMAVGDHDATEETEPHNEDTIDTDYPESAPEAKVEGSEKEVDSDGSESSE